MKKRCLFIDRDGTLVREPSDEQVDSLEKVTFLPGVFTHLGRIARLLDYEMVMVTNQDGLGTTSFPEETFWPAQQFITGTLAGEGIVFADTLIDRSFPDDHAPTRKPGTGMLTAYMDAERYNLKDSFVIGDRESDMQLAENLGCIGLGLGTSFASEAAIAFGSWEEIASYLFRVQRQAIVQRKTRETNIRLELSLDGDGTSQISTGIGFFDHMLDQIGRHAQVEMNLHVEGDLDVDEHHTVEDTALALGEAFRVALGNKRGISRYGFEVPMDDASAKVLIDFGGRPWFIWKAQFQREKIGQLPTELLPHFFKSFSDAAGCNLHIEATGENEHHTCEAIFKAFARAIRMAKSLNGNQQIPSTKGIL